MGQRIFQKKEKLIKVLSQNKSEKWLRNQIFCKFDKLDGSKEIKFFQFCDEAIWIIMYSIFLWLMRN